MKPFLQVSTASSLSRMRLRLGLIDMCDFFHRLVADFVRSENKLSAIVSDKRPESAFGFSWHLGIWHKVPSSVYWIQFNVHLWTASTGQLWPNRDKVVDHMDNIQNEQDADRFMHGIGLRISREVVREIIGVLTGEVPKTLYDLFAAGERRDGSQRQPVCGKGTAYKIKKLYDDGDIEPYLSYLSLLSHPNQRGQGDPCLSEVKLETDDLRLIVSDHPMTKWHILPKDLPLPELVVFTVSGSFQLTNLGMERTIERIYCRLIVDDQEIAKGTVFEDPNYFFEIEVGWRIKQLDTTLDTKKFHCKCNISRYDLQRAVGFTYEKSELELVVEATGSRDSYRFPTSREESLLP